MSHGLKFRILLVATLIIGLGTAPVWWPLLSTRDGTTWTNRDTVILFLPDPTNWAGSFELQVRFQSLAEQYGENRGRVVQLSVDRPDAGEAGASDTPYLFAVGQAASLLENCYDGARLDPVTEGAIASPDIPEIAGTGPAVLLRLDSWLSCNLPPEQFWTERDATFSFSAPRLVISGPELPLGWSAPIPAGSPCLYVTLNRGLGVTVDYESSTPMSERPVQSDFRNLPTGFYEPELEQRRWSYCRETEDVIAAGSLKFRLTDLALAPSVSRNTFIAGALVGLLGALIIEAFNAGLEAHGSRIDAHLRVASGLPRRLYTKARSRLPILRRHKRP